MKSFLKVTISLIVFIVVFVLLFFFSHKYFSVIDSHIYQASAVSSIKSELSISLDSFDVWQTSLHKSFSDFAKDAVVRRCMDITQTDGDIALREKTAADLNLLIPYMKGIRVIEKDTERLHFSTFSNDIISKTSNSVSYVKYGKNQRDIPYSEILLATSNNLPCVDMKDNTFIFAIPFNDEHEIQRGSVLFYVSAKSFARKLINEKHIPLNDEIELITDDKFSFVGILIGLPYEDSQALKDE